METNFNIWYIEVYRKYKLMQSIHYDFFTKKEMESKSIKEQEEIREEFKNK